LPPNQQCQSTEGRTTHYIFHLQFSLAVNEVCCLHQPLLYCQHHTYEQNCIKYINGRSLVILSSKRGVSETFVCLWQIMEHVTYMPREAKKEQERLQLAKTVLFVYNCFIFVSQLLLTNINLLFFFHILFACFAPGLFW